MIHNVVYNVDKSYDMYHSNGMSSPSETQQERALSLLKQQGMVRLSEFREAGITATTVSRMKEKGLLLQLSRGLYQLPDASVGTHHSLAEAAKLVPKGIVCLTSALAFHGLTDTIASRVWMAIGAKDRRPRIETPPLQFARFGDKVLTSGIQEQTIEGVCVRLYNPAKTVVDLFRYRRSAGRRYQKSPGLNLALEGLREALRQRKASPAEIARYANEAGVWKVVQPYLEAMTSNA
jgi:predicted transcriptional regulator of viral defense system